MPMLRVGMQFVTLCVTRRFCDVSDVCLRAPDYRADAPRRHAVRDALRHTAVLRCQ